MERETGIEPATNSLEGCDSTTELLPPSRTHCARATAGKPAPAQPLYLYLSRHRRHASGRKPTPAPRYWPASRSSLSRPASLTQQRRAKAGGEGRIRTSEAARATDLQSAAFDRFATSPSRTDAAPVTTALSAANPTRPPLPPACGTLNTVVDCPRPDNLCGLNRPRHGASILGAGEGI